MKRLRRGVLASCLALAMALSTSTSAKAAETMTVTPGQDATVACACAPMILRPTENQGVFPADEGMVLWLIPSSGGSDDLTILKWESSAIFAQLPPANPGSGEDGETFTVRMTDSTGQSVYFETTEPVVIAGPTGNYPDPPMHTS